MTAGIGSGGALREGSFESFMVLFFLRLAVEIL
jgi:hypothetical protein